MTIPPSRNTGADTPTPTRSLRDAPPPERLGPPAALNAEQHEAAQALVNGPRGGVYGPFRPLLHRPPLLHAVAKVGEVLRYQGTLAGELREWTICVVAHELANVFEWRMHRPLAEKAGVPAAALAALEAGLPLPPDLQPELALAAALARELLANHDVSDAHYAAALRAWGEPALVEWLTLVGYFAMVSWLMNVARTPGPSGAG
ncbi:MAG: carboxymuconolactone decarboxylase family protein [Burkholderiales bacterium]|nr:carboxymuconolactone decarboxylase family protein [Burkholderiales bacterium]